MANRTIIQRIAMEGGDQIRAQLSGIGKAARDAFQELKTQAESVGSETATRFLEIEQAAQNFGKAISDAGKSFAEFGKGLTQVGAVIASVATGFTLLVNNAASAADAAGKAAQSMGVSVKEFGRVKFALEQSGAGAETGQKAFNKLAQGLADTSGAGNKITQTLNQLGISITKNADGTIKMESLLGDIAERFRAMPDGVQKTALAMNLFGEEAGPKLIPLLNKGRSGLTALGNEAEKLGVVFTAEQAKIGTALTNSVGKFTSTFGALKNQVGIVFGPLVTEVFDTLTKIFADAREPLVNFAKTIKEQIEGPIKEILAAISGQEDKVKTSWIVALVESVKTLGTVVKETYNAIKVSVSAIVTILDELAKGFNSIFGTNLTGQQVLITGLLLKITGALGLMVAAVKLVVAGVGLLVAIFGGWAVAIALIIAAVVLLIANNEKVVNGVKAAWDTVVKFFTDLWTSITTNASAAWQWIKDKATEAGNAIKSFFTETLPNALSSAWETVKTTILGVFDAIIERAKAVIDLVAKALGASSGDGGGAGFARGGFVRGPGTSRSDSIPALLSDREYVHPARAVRHYGLPFMEAIRQLRFPRFDFSGLNLDRMMAVNPTRRFADGGLAVAAARASTPGSGLRPTIIQIPGFGDAPMMAEGEVLERLSRFAVKGKVRSAGRKPPWFT